MGRQPSLGAVCGKKAVGKSFRTIEFIRDYVRNSPRRKALIYDVNNEYSEKSKFPDVKTISLANVPMFAAQKWPEIARVGPFYDDGRKMTLSDMSEVLMWILRNYHSGLLLIEDVNKYVDDNMPGDLIGAICTNRHSGVDIILHYQSVGRITRKVWQNINWLRMHKNTDSVAVHRDKFEDKYEYIKIAELIVNEQYKAGNTRYYLFVDIDHEKIHCTLSEDIIRSAILEYVAENYRKVVGRYLYKRDGKGSALYNEEQSFKKAIDDIYADYFV